MDYSHNIFIKKSCFICEGQGKVNIVFKIDGKLHTITTLCFHCLGKGYLKLLKSDYDY